MVNPCGVTTSTSATLNRPRLSFTNTVGGDGFTLSRADQLARGTREHQVDVQLEAALANRIDWSVRRPTAITFARPNGTAMRKSRRGH